MNAMPQTFAKDDVNSMVNAITNTMGDRPLMKISDEEFEIIRKLVYDRFGINLTDRKRSLVVGRLQKVLRKRGFATFQQYCDFLTSSRDPDVLTELANHISTNHTYFFRENEHFDFLANVALPAIIARHRENHCRDIRIWCAAASSGEEPYSLVITLMETLGGEYGQWDAGLLATDISEKVLAMARRGVYAEERLKLTPPALRSKYFVRKPDGQWEVTDKLKREITFRRFNLMNKSFPFRKPFDAIFCRNVMIYFDQPTRDALIARMHQSLAPGGYFFVGHSESLGRQQTLFQYIQPAVYQK